MMQIQISSYYEIIDIVLAELKERFNSESLDNVDIYAAANAIMGDQDFSGGAYAESIGLEFRHLKHPTPDRSPALS